MDMEQNRLWYTAWCSEIGSLTSLDAPEFHASGDLREPILLHHAVDIWALDELCESWALFICDTDLNY